MYYNKDMFEAAGLDLPTDDWTMDDFYAAAKALTNPMKMSMVIVIVAWM